jgi:ABC-type antimicrobial peptide transport system permease subunit
MSEVADATILQERLTAQIATLCSMLALLLACTGLFGVLSYNVTRHTKEIGIHMALGARAVQIVAAVMRETIVIVGIGLMLGLVGVFGTTRFISR